MTSQTDSHKSIPDWLGACLLMGNAADHRVDTEATNNGEFDPDSVWWVEVGGRDASQPAAVAKAFPQSPARIILQNSPTVLGAAPKVEGVEMMAHDILTEQPVHSELLHTIQWTLV